MQRAANTSAREAETGGIRLSAWHDGKHTHANELAAHLRKLDLPDAGVEYVVNAYTSPPARRVGTHRVRNLIFDVPLPQFGVTLQAESATGEYSFLLERSRDPKLQMILDQPTAVFFDITNTAGVRTPVRYTADYLVVHDTKVIVYEVILQKELDELLGTRKVDWKVSTDGRPRCLPAEEYFGRLGIIHEVHVGEEISGVRAGNLRTLHAVRRFPDSTGLASERNKVLRLLGKHDSLPMSEIVRQLDLPSCTSILQLVDSGDLHVDMDSCVLSDPRSVWVAIDPSLPRHLTRGRARLVDALGSDQSISALDVCPPQYEAEFLTRLACCGLAEAENVQFRAARTVRSYLRQVAQANGDVRVLIPGWGRSGNRTPRKCSEHYDVLFAVIRKARSDPNGSSTATAFLDYQVTLKEELGDQERPFSETTFYDYFDRTAGAADDARLRGGRRMGNAATAWLDPLKRTLLPTRPFEVAHIDHWNVDIQCVLRLGSDRTKAQRPWLTAMVDSFTGEVLALWLTYRHPSSASCAMVLRDCVRRHGRLPEIIVVDGGQEFDSVHFASTLATLGVTKTNRPPEDPRFGEEVERLFGALKERLARGKPGFTEGIKASRKVSGRFTAEKRARLSIGDLLSSIETFIFTSYNNEPSPGELVGRATVRKEALAALPFSGITITWDTRFLILTSVEAHQSSYKLIPPRGIRVLDRWYSCPALSEYRGRKRRARVRIDPFDDSVIYVCLEDLWYVCYSSDASMSLHSSDFAAFERTSLRHQLRGLLKDVMRAAARDAYALQYGSSLELDAKPEPTARIRTRTTEASAVPDIREGSGESFEDILEIPLEGEAR